MANQYFQFTMNFGTPPSITTQFSSGSAGPGTWQAYVEPNFNNGVVRSGGPGGRRVRAAGTIRLPALAITSSSTS